MFENITINKPNYLSDGNENWQVNNLSRINILFGKNGSGKSLLLRNLAQKENDYVHYIPPQRHGNITTNSRLLDEVSSNDKRFSRNKQNFSNDYHQQVIIRIRSFYEYKGKFEDRSNIFSRSDIEYIVNLACPDFKFELPDKGLYKLIRRQDGSEVGKISNISSGEAQVFTLALDIAVSAAEWVLKNKEKRILLIDEPDAHLHDDLQDRLAEIINFVSYQYDIQIIVATHSSALLSSFGHYGKEDVGIIFLNAESTNINAKPFDSYKRDLVKILGGTPLHATVFGAPILLVEGDDEYRIWSQANRSNSIDLTVFPCGGSSIKNYQKSLEQLFDSISNRKSNLGFALIDNDNQKPLVKQERIKYIQLNCHESENLYLTEEVLKYLGYSSWAEASDKILKESKNYPETPNLKTVKHWDPLNEDIKNEIKNISKILDKTSNNWALTIGRVVGKGKPSGQLAKFLGSEVLKALWGN